ncbi:MAG: MFS transporter [Chloroflexi bacterium]|nr:MFS transporter [Chloroflexota bacterium]
MHLRKWDAYRVYLILSGVSSLLFSLIFTLNLVYQAQVVGLTPLQLVLVGTTLETSAFLFEIPTGIVADLYSRRLSVIIGFFLIGIGFTIEGSLPFFAAVLANQVIWGIGSTFTSGALEAWIVDEVGEERIGPVFLRGSQAGQVGGIAGILISVALGSIALALPVVIGGLAFVVLAIFLLLVMPETGFKPTPRGERTHLQSMFDPLREGIRLVRVRPLLLTFMAIVLVGGLYSEGFDRLRQAHLLRNYTLPALGSLNPVVWFGIISIVGMLLTAGVTEIIRRRLNTENQRAVARTLMGLYALLIVGLLGFALAENIWIALIALSIASTMRGVTDPIFSTWANRYIDSNVRATVLSSFGQLNALGQIGGGPLVGFIGDRFGIRAALSASAVLLTPILWLIARAARHPALVEAEPVVAPVETS